MVKRELSNALWITGTYDIGTSYINSQRSITMSKYKHIVNIVLALAAAFAAVVLFIFMLPILCYVLVTIAVVVTAWHIGTFAFTVALAAILRR
jgi:hypothetical protein